MNADVLTIHNLLQSAPTREWYIAGGSVATPNDFEDIDVFISTDAAFQLMFSFMSTTFEKVYETSNAITYLYTAATKTITIQLIRYAYPVQEQLERFDLNVCRKALLPDGSIYSHPTSSLPLYVAGVIGYNTPQRFCKYLDRTGSFDESKLIDFMELIRTTRPSVSNFYDDTEHTLDFSYLIPLFFFFFSTLVSCCATYISKFSPKTRLKIVNHLSNYFNCSLFSYSIDIPEFALLHYLRTRTITPQVQQYYPEYLL